MESYVSALSGNINITTITISYQVNIVLIHGQMDLWSLSTDSAPFNCLGITVFCLYESENFE